MEGDGAGRLPAAWEWSTVDLADGRIVEVLTSGPSAEAALLFHVGTPMAAAAFTPLSELAAAHDARTVMYSRPGYGRSTPQPGRRVADSVSDVVAVLDALGAETFFSLGWSGGGPFALACAALLPARCAAVVTVASIAPYEAEGLDWMAGMSESNIEEYTLAPQGSVLLTPLLEKWAPDLAALQPKDVGKALSTRSDLNAVTVTGFRQFVADSHSRSVSTGVVGWRDDDLACIRPWGFNIGAIKCPVSVWHGGKDVQVPHAHGRWLSDHMPRARFRSLPDENHSSIVVAALDRIVADLFETH